MFLRWKLEAAVCRFVFEIIGINWGKLKKKQALKNWDICT